MLSGLPIYYVLIRPNKSPNSVQLFLDRGMGNNLLFSSNLLTSWIEVRSNNGFFFLIDSVTAVIQKLLVSVPEERDNDEDLCSPNHTKTESSKF